MRQPDRQKAGRISTDPEGYNAPWTDATFVAFDLEGTGPQEGEDEGIVEVGAVVVKDCAITDSRFSTLVNPERKIPWVVTRIHGIRDRDVAAAPTIQDIHERLRTLLDHRVMVAHNAHVDWNLLRRRCPGLAPLAVIDTLKLVRAWRPDIRTRSLPSLIEHFALEPLVRVAGSRDHRAAHDALATAHLFLRLLQERTGSTITVADLVALAGVPHDPAQSSPPEAP